MELRELVKRAHETAQDHGFWDDLIKLQACQNQSKAFDLMSVAMRLVVNEKLALIHSELSEALEEERDGYPRTRVRYGKENKPEGFAVELADAIIRIADLAGGLGIDLASVIEEKLLYNEGRPHKHGRTC